MTKKRKRTKADNITMRGFKVRNSPILTCKSCARRYIETEKGQKKCLFCMRDMADFTLPDLEE